MNISSLVINLKDNRRIQDEYDDFVVYVLSFMSFATVFGMNNKIVLFVLDSLFASFSLHKLYNHKLTSLPQQQDPLVMVEFLY